MLADQVGAEYWQLSWDCEELVEHRKFKRLFKPTGPGVNPTAPLDPGLAHPSTARQDASRLGPTRRAPLARSRARVHTGPEAARRRGDT